MKLIGYEIQKLLHQKIGIAIIFIGIILAMLLFPKSDKLVDSLFIRNNHEIANEYEREIKGMKYGEALSWFSEKKEEEDQKFADTKEQKYVTRSIVLKKLVSKYEYVAYYEEYLQGVLTQAEQMKKMQMFIQDSRFVTENIESTEDVFRKLIEAQIEPQLDAPQFISDATAYQTFDLIIVMQIVILIMLIFGYDEQIKGRFLLNTQYKGRFPVYAAKCATSLMFSAIILFIDYIAIFLQSYIIYGNGGNMSVPLQSFEDFKGSPFIISVAEFLVLFMLFKLAGILVIASTTIFWVNLTGVVGGTILSFFCYGVGYVAYTLIGETSVYSPIKYINPAAWNDVYKWMSEYINVNIFNNAVSFGNVYIVAGILVFVFSLVLSAVLYCKRAQVGNRKCTLNIWLKIFGGRNIVLWKHEGYKFLFSKKQILLFIVLAWGVLFFVSNYVKEPNNSFAYSVYGNYLEIIEYRYDEETESELQEIEAYLYEKDGYRSELLRQKEEGILSIHEYEKKVSKLNEDIKLRKGFEKLTEQWKYLKDASDKTDEKVGFVHTELIRMLFENQSQQMIFALASSVIIILIICIFAKQDRNMLPFIRTMSKGRGEYITTNMGVSILIALMVAMIVYIPYYFKVFGWFGIDKLKVSVFSIEGYEKLSPNFTVFQVFFISMSMKILACILSALLAYGFSLWRVKNTVFFSVVFSALIFPLVLGYKEEVIRYLCLGGLFYGEDMLKKGLGISLLYLVATVMFVVVFVIISVLQYEKGKKLIKRGGKG